MQKKIIALAVAGLVSGVAMAQSNVTVFGYADAGYAYTSDSFVKGAKNTSKILPGALNGSRIGFKGEEALGNGLKAVFQIQQGIKIDQGGEDIAADRWATVGLTSASWGTAEIGRRDTFIDQLLGGTDVQGRTLVSQVSPVMRDIGRIGNFVAYTSPVIAGGLTLKAGFSTSAYAAEDAVTVINTTTNVRVYTAAAEYVNGPLKVGAAYQYNKAQGTNTTSYDAGKEWAIAGQYTFGPAVFSAQYGQIVNGDGYVYSDLNGVDNTGTAKTTALVEKRKQWTVAALYNITPADRVSLGYAKGKNDFFAAATNDEKQSMWGVSYFHDLSKRTTIYAGYGSLSQDASNTVKYGINSTYEKALQAGLRHSF